MQRNFLHLIVDIALALAMIGLLATGLLIALVIPPGHGHDSVWSMTRHEWGDIHYYLALGMIAVIVLHVLLNWGWVCTVCAKVWHRNAKKPSKLARNLSGAALVGAVVAVVGGFLLAASGAVVEGEGEHGNGEGRGFRGERNITAMPITHEQATPPQH